MREGLVDGVMEAIADLNSYLLLSYEILDCIGPAA